MSFDILARDSYPPAGSELVRTTLRQFLDLLDDHLLPAGPAGGPAWSTAQRAALWHSIESRWPLGPLTCWAPSGNRGAWYLLDGHRRVATIREATEPAGTPLWRDVEQDSPDYHDSTPWSGRWLPTTAMIRTLDFLHATRHWPQPTRRRAEHVAAAVFRAPIDVLILTGGQPRQVQQLCDRLLGERVEAATITTVAGHDSRLTRR
jgi:hypothetical protein